MKGSPGNGVPGMAALRSHRGSRRERTEFRRTGAPQNPNHPAQAAETWVGHQAPEPWRSGLWRPCLALLLFAVALSRPAFPADVKPELEFQPSTVSLPVGVAQQATVLIVVHNPTDATLRDLRLSWLAKPSLDVQSTTPLSLSTFPPYADHVWTLAIKPSRTLASPGAAAPAALARPRAEAEIFTTTAPRFGQPDTLIDENLDLRLDYEISVGGRTSPQVVLKSLPVKTQNLGDLEKALDVQIKTTFESLDSSQWGSIYLVLKNNSARTINLINITPIGRGVSFCQGSKAPYGGLPFCFYSSFHSLILAPYQTAIEEFPVKASDRLKGGKYLLVFQIAAQASQDGAPLRRNMIISQLVDVDVPGESALLTVAGIPVFFLLPGTLLLLAIGLCWSLEERWWPLPDRDEFPLKCTEPNFWLVSVIFSLLIAIIPWLFRKRWYFTRYRLQDIGLLWFASILAGMGCYVIWWIYRNHRRLQAAERIRLLAHAAAQLRARTRT
jgi:cbb3-type cytochrome oxidase subunit 3